MHTGKEAHIDEDYFCGLQHAFWTGLELAAIQFSMESKQRPFFLISINTINKRQEALSRLPNSWLLRLSQHARDEKSSSKHTRKAKKRARLASFSCLFNLWRKKKPLKLAFDKIDSYFSVFNLCCSTYNYSSWEFNNDILRGTSFSQPYSDFLMILHIG